MPTYELNDLGPDWTWTAETEGQATAQYIDAVCGAKNLSEYEDYCQTIGVDPRLDWREV